jgi:hypothetical protein
MIITVRWAHFDAKNYPNNYLQKHQLCKSSFIGTKMLLGQEKPVLLRRAVSIMCVGVEKWS